MVPVIATASPARAPKAVEARGSFVARGDVEARGNFEARTTKSREERERGMNDGEPTVRSSGMEAIFRYGI
jgi:hypothetical protein